MRGEMREGSQCRKGQGKGQGRDKVRDKGGAREGTKEGTREGTGEGTRVEKRESSPLPPSPDHHY